MVGKTVSHYKILEKIGSGGMGVIYKAQDLKLDRFVALKFLPPHLTTSEEEKQRFIHEAKAASSLDHNNICNIYEIDETEDGQLFISMAYYEGETLDKRIKDKPLPIEEAIDISIQIAQGLAKAHEKEIVHRDIKPANIMLTKEGVAKVLDFGLAKLSTQTKLTKESTTLGTVSYMSPEQAKGEEVDHKTDIWSLGVILYEMLTGQLPFKGEYESAVIYSIINDIQEPVTALRTGVPMELERIINKCLQKSPAERYQHFDELVVDLRGLRRESESTIIPSKEEKQKKRSKSVLLPVAILSIIFLIVVGYFLIQPSDKSETGWENSIAVLPFDNISNDPEQEYFCDGMTEQIISNLAKLPKLKVISRTSVMKYKATDKALPEIGKELNVAHVLEGSVRKFGDRIRVTAQLIGTEDDFHIWTENYDREYKELFNVQDEVSEAIANNLLANLSPQELTEVKTNRPNNTEAYEYYLKGDYIHYRRVLIFTDIEDFKQAELMFKRSIALDSTYAPAYAGLADLYNTMYNSFDLSETEKKKYIELQEQNIEIAYNLDPSSAQVNVIKGWVHMARGDLEKAHTLFKKGLKLNPNDSYSSLSIGIFYYNRGLFNHALKFINKSVELDPLYNLNIGWRINTDILLGDFERAENDCKKVLEMNSNKGTLQKYVIISVWLEKYKQAEELISKLKQLDPEDSKNRFFEAISHAIKGEKEKALENDFSIDYAHNRFEELEICLLLKLVDKSIQIMNDYFDDIKERGNSLYLTLENHPAYNFLRADPRFQEILAKHKELYEENLAKYGDIDI